MPRKQTNFSRALKEAKLRLKEATGERTRYEAKLHALGIEIPSLQGTINALQRQMNPDWKPPQPDPATYRIVHRNSETGEISPASPVPIDLAPYRLPEDLSTMGSIPAIVGEATRELSEDELLDDGSVDGEELLP